MVAVVECLRADADRAADEGLFTLPEACCPALLVLLVVDVCTSAHEESIVFITILILTRIINNLNILILMQIVRTLVHFFFFIMDNLKSKTTELVAALTRRVGEIIGNSTELGVLQDEYEITRATLTIAHAMVNPINIDWDVDRYAEKVKLSPPNLDGLPSAETDRLKKFFPEEHVNHITVGLRDTLLKSLTNKNTWRDEGYMVPDGGGEFGAGRITVVPAYFMQRQERLMDLLVTSESYKSKKVQQWMAALTISEVLWNAITAMVAPDLF
ncbi:uncharacterized protein F5147DRAFT_651354 [Suillus discolor]|uniref:Uncharacterized protein n=1 Tax=Suillus discolor TaxID=1912936 RepID=A0A9P7FBE4_9AGAM|nr:uncharacterized protein F5147DRAFT_651354 [Suillus discolor]KAG2111727.1 hypothetical protein F5147DRAFT_651354 [Suillus discolor]